MSEQTGSHTVGSQETFIDQTVDEAVKEALAMFGVEDDTNVSPETENVTESPAEAQEGQSEAPATEQKREAEKKVYRFKLKVDKEEREFEVPEDQIAEYVQKAYVVDRERERRKELHKNLERAARLAGFEKVEDYLANLDRLEQEAKQREESRFQEIREKLREEAEFIGLKPEEIDNWINNHPRIKEAERILRGQQEAERQRAIAVKWQELYNAYPELVESSKAFDEGGVPDWFTPEMQALVERGYDPKHAYELAHRDKILEQVTQKAIQKAIKEQRLGLRAQAETNAASETEPEVPDDLATAFAMFGLPKEAARKYVKK